MNDIKFIKLCFYNLSETQKELLVALLADVDYTGFEEDGVKFMAYINEDDFKLAELDAVLKLVPAEYTKSVIPQQNWNAQWESSFEPIVVGDFVSIRAGFHQPVQNVQHEIIITPKMSFGTGHHATTYMMIEQMQPLDFKDKTVVDFGTGRAVLAILAEKMGANYIDAIDYDEWSIENSIENAAANNCSKINLIKADTIATDNVYDIILANINLNIIMANLQAIKTVSKRGSLILLSGFVKSDEVEMINVLSETGIRHLKTLQKLDWICIVAEVN